MEVDQQLAPPVVGVVVVHDVDDWFDETVAALAAQDYPNVRWLFLVTGDDDEAVSARVTARIPGAFVRRAATDSGFGPAANEVLTLVEGDNGFFWICHDDVAPSRDALRVMVAELYRSNAGVVGPKLVEWDDPRRLQHVGLGLDRFGEVDPIVEPGEMDQEQHDAVRDVFVLPSACLLVRADLFRTLGGFDPAISFHGDDVDLCWRIHLSGARVVVAPDAVVRHRERLEERRPDLDHRQLRARHRMRAVATLTGGSRLLGRSVQMILLTAVEVVVGLFTGRLGDGVASLRSLLGLVPRSPSILARRRAVHGGRRVPEREVIGLQVRGSARLTSYVRGRETTTYLGVGSTVRRWRPTSYAPVLAWFAVVTAVVVGSRTFIDRGVPEVGEFLRFPESPRDLLRDYLSAWDPRATGVTTAVPTGWASLALLSVLSAFRMELAMTMAVVGMVLIGASGAWRLATVFPSGRARIAAMVVYAGTPLVPGLMATGRWSALAWYAALPWAVHLLRRIAGIGTADPDLADIDLVDGVADLLLRERIRYLALLSLVLALTAAFVPVVVVLWLVVGLALVVASLAVGGSVQTAGWFSLGVIGSTIAAAALNLPWSASWTWSSLVPAPLAGGAADGLADTAALSVDGRAFAVLGLALYVPVVAALAMSRAWRLTWAARGAALVVVFGAAAVLADRGDLPVSPPEISLLMVPVALGLGLSAASIAGGFGEDVRERGFGWRQPLALVANIAIVVGLVPAVTAIGNGAWGAPRTPLPTLLAAQLPADPPEGDYRVLFVGDPRVLPVPASEYRDGVGFAVVDDGPLDFTERWSPPVTDADPTVRLALDRIADASTLRAGRLLAPLGIRYIVVPDVDGAESTVSEPLPVPAGLVESLGDQLDLGETFGAPDITVFVNRAWVPATALLTGATAEASRVTDDASLARADLSGATGAFGGAASTLVVTDEIGPGVIHLGSGFDDRWWLEVGGERVPAREGFGVTTAFDVPEAAGAATAARLGYDSPASRTVSVVLQSVLWLLVLLAATRAKVVRSRRSAGPLTDETLIQLDDESVPAFGTDALAAAAIGEWTGSTIAGEVLARDTTGPIPRDPAVEDDGATDAGGSA